MNACPSGARRRPDRTLRPAGRRVRFGRPVLTAVLALAGVVLGLTPAAPQAERQYGPLNVPGAFEVLNPTAVNGAGQTIVNYMDSSFAMHSAVIDPTGNATLVAVPGANHTLAYSINNAGQIVGSYFVYDPAKGYSTHGFYRDPASGSYSTIDVAGGASSSTQAMSINDLGQIAGSYYDNTGEHGFLRNPNGQYTTIDAPTSVGGFHYTVAAAVNNFGQVAGYFYGTTAASSTVSEHGFLRNPDGTFTVIDYPTTEGAVPFTSITGLNDLGQIVGLTYSPTYHGFLTDAGGQFTSIDYPATAQYHFTTPWDIDGAGRIVGTYRDGAGLHGFTAQGTAPTLPAAPARGRQSRDPAAGLRRLQSALCIGGKVESFFDDAAPVGGLSAIAETSARVDLLTTDAVPLIGLVSLEALGYQYLGCIQNAPDPSFTAAVTPELHVLPPIPAGGGISTALATALTSTIGHGSNAAGYLQALSVALNRYRAALAADDASDASAQRSAVFSFARSAGTELAAFSAGLRTAAGLIRGTAFDGSVATASLQAALAQIRAQGASALPGIEQGGFRMFGLDPSYLLAGDAGTRHDGARPGTSLSSALLETARVMDRLSRILHDGTAH
jgi:uncharacterized membrane protein